MASEFEKSVLAEVLCLNQALGQLLVIQAKSTGAPDAFLRDQMERGLHAISVQNLWGVNEAEAAEVRENAAARFSDLMTTAAKVANR